MARMAVTPAFILTLALACVAVVALAQSPGPGAAPTQAAPATAGVKPTWKDLSPAQREALAPLANDWETFDRSRKLKWLDVANKYSQLSPDGQKRLHERMAEFVKLTPEQRNTARMNFQRAYELPMEQRQSLVQQYQELPPEKKQALAEKATKKTEPPRRGAPKPEPKPDSPSDPKAGTSKP
ncbi:MAG TPA: DUF3106 domain-containing protein [Burkholderiaceae bacterium]|nr:DUF3106 domain-containing protein [Burkholderiaceae bacterium]